MCIPFKIPHLSDKSYDICSPSDFIWSSLGPSMLLQMASLHSFLWLSHIPIVCIYTTRSLSIPLSTGGLLISVSWLLYIVVHWATRCLDLFELVFQGHMPRSGIAGSYGSSIFSLFMEPPHCSSGLVGHLRPVFPYWSSIWMIYSLMKAGC